MPLLVRGGRGCLFQSRQLGLGLELEQLRPAKRPLLHFRERRQIFRFGRERRRTGSRATGLRSRLGFGLGSDRSRRRPRRPCFRIGGGGPA